MLQSLVFKDKYTASPFVEIFPEDDGEAKAAALPDHIYMDAMGFGMGNCCLQVQMREQMSSVQWRLRAWLTLTFACRSRSRPVA